MDSGGGARPEDELRFMRALHDPGVMVPSEAPESGAFDWILIDTPPAQTFYTRAAIAASHHVLIPIEAEAFAAKGIERVLQTIRAMQALVGEGANLLGAVVTCWRSIPSAQNDKWTQLQAYLLAEGVYLFNHAIPYDDSIDQAHLSTIRGSQRSIFGFGGQPKKSAVAYVNLLRKVKERIEDADHCGN
jgi:chromosome partitioning protein